MPVSEYVTEIRRHIGTQLLMLPGVTAVITNERGEYLLARHVDGDRWGFVGGAVEPREEPRDALIREVREELGTEVEIHSILGAYGGPELVATYDNGDVVAYVTTAYRCRILGTPELEAEELSQAGWFDAPSIPALPRFEWIDRVIADAERS